MRSGELQFFADPKRLLDLDQCRFAEQYAFSDAEPSLLVALPAVRFSAQVDRASRAVKVGEEVRGVPYAQTVMFRCPSDTKV